MLLSPISGLPVATGESEASDSGAACWTIGFTCLTLDQVLFFSEKIMACCLSLDTTTFIAVLLCFFPI